MLFLFAETIFKFAKVNFVFKIFLVSPRLRALRPNDRLLPLNYNDISRLI